MKKELSLKTVQVLEGENRLLETTLRQHLDNVDETDKLNFDRIDGNQDNSIIIIRDF